MKVNLNPRRVEAVLASSTGELVTIDDGAVHVHIPGKVDTNNSSSTPLAADATYLGTAMDSLDFSIMYLTVYSDVESATDGLVVEVSSDGLTGWRTADNYTIPSLTEKTFAFQLNKAFHRVKYTNGSTLQTAFDLQVVLKRTNALPSSHRIIDSISQQDDATLVKAVLTALADGDGFTNLTATKSNNLKVANVEDGLSIAKGDVADTTFVHKFGNAHDFDTSDGWVTIYDGADDADINQMKYQYSTSADIDSISSGSAADTQDLEIQGLDINYNLVNQTVTLSGQTRVPLTTNLFRVFRMKNVNSVDNIGHVYCYVNGAITSGRPNDSTTVRAVIQPENNQTLMAVYTVPAGKTAYMRKWYASTSGAKKTSNYIVELRARPIGGVFQIKHIQSLSDTATSVIEHTYEDPEVFSEKTDVEMRCTMTAGGGTEGSVSAGFDIVLIDN